MPNSTQLDQDVIAMRSAELETPPPVHKDNMTATKSHLRRNSRSACTTSSTVLTCQSTPNSSFEHPESPALDYYRVQEEDVINECNVPSFCFAGWILSKLLSPHSPSKIDVFSPANDPSHLRDGYQQSSTNAVDRVPSQQTLLDDSLRLKLCFDDCEDEIHNEPSCSSTCQSSTDASDTARSPDHSEIIQIHNLLILASKYEDKDDLNAAISQIESYLYQAHFLSDQTSFFFECRRAAALHKLGCLQWKCGRYQLSLYALLEARNLYDSLIEECSIGSQDVSSNLQLASASVLVSTGRLHLSRGEGAAAMRCYRECVQRLSSMQSSYEQSESARVFAQACSGAGQVLLSQGKFSASLKRLKRALKVQLGYQGADIPVSREEISSLSFHTACVPLPEIAETLSHLGRLYEKQGSLHESMQCFSKSFGIYSMALGPNHADAADISNKLGRVLLRLGRFSEAEQAIRRAYQIFGNNLGQHHRNTSTAFLNLGMLYAYRGQHNRALDVYYRVLHIQHTLFGEEVHADLAITYHYIAESNEALFKLDKAIKYYREELRVLETTLHPYHLDIAKLLHHMAMVTMNAVDSDGNYLMLNECIGWLEEATEVYSHHNESNQFDEEIHCVQVSIQELQRRNGKLA